MQETLTIEAVNTKPFSPKYSSGSVLAGGIWMQVAKSLPISSFQKGTQLEVETSVNDKGYKSIVGLPTTTSEPRKAVKAAKTTSESLSTAKTTTVTNYEDNKNRRIQVQGLIQATIQSPSTINFGDNPKEVALKVLELADLLIQGMEERV